MKTLTRLTVLVALGACVVGRFATAENAPPNLPDAQKILAASDAVRNPAKPFGLSIVLTEYRNAKESDSNTLAIYSKLDAGGGYRTLVSYVGPPRDAGKLALEN